MELVIDKSKFPDGLNLDRFKEDLISANLKGQVISIKDNVTNLLITGDQDLNNMDDINKINTVVADHDGTPDPDSALNNLTATTDPTITDDINAGYSKASVWINTATETIFILVDSSSGSAVWRKIMPEHPYFFEYVESEPKSETILSDFVEKVKLTTSSLAAGDYLIEYCAEIGSDGADEIKVQIELDDITFIGKWNVKSNSDMIFGGMQGFQKVNLSSGIHTVDIDFKSMTGGLVHIRRARISIKAL